MLKDTLLTLLSIPGPSGSEGACADYIEETVRPARREARPFRPVSRAPQREEIVEETERLPREERPEAPTRLHSSRTAEPAAARSGAARRESQAPSRAGAPSAARASPTRPCSR